jgi:Zn-dependent peptidase ImmA (M78 family)/DNA-binding XRE family transcriptional regulator
MRLKLFRALLSARDNVMKYDSIDISGLADRLVSARKSANMTQDDAAKFLGMSRPTFIAVEKAIRRPKPDEIVKLAELYRVPLNKLLRNEGRPQPMRPHLRSILDGHSNGEKELEAAITLLTDYVDDYQFLENLMETKAVTQFPPRVRIAPGSIERFAEHCAQQERARLDLGAHQPIYTLRNTLEESGIHIFIEPLDSKLAGLYVFAPDFGYCILVNRVHPRERRRWTIAHEYGHFLADRDNPGVDFSKPMQRKTESEKFADAFAAAFLMPEAGVQRRFYEDLERSRDFKVGDLCRMADHFAVSLMAMALRLESIGLIPKGSWDQISDSRVPVRVLKQEAGILPSPDSDSAEPYPQRYKLLAVQAFLDDKISEGQLSKLLRCSRIDAREIVELCSEAADDVDEAQLPVRLSLTRSLLAVTAV